MPLIQLIMATMSLLAGSVVFCLPLVSHAQEMPAEVPPEDDMEPIEMIIVTGSRIKRRDFSSPSPLITVDREDFEFSGQPTVEEYLNQMPQLIPDFGRTVNNGSDGTARLNLRGLGAGRTLVLLNGRRLAPSGVGSAVDVNNLPRALLERVEIITGGASTVYGSDAIAGVVNFITVDSFEGIGIDSSYSVTSDGDSDIFDVNFLFGHNLASGRGNITAYAGYYDRKELFASEREHTRVQYTEDWDTGELVPFGSSIIPEGRVAFPLVDLGAGPVSMTWNPDGTPRAADPVNDAYNFAPVNYLQAPLTRTTAGVMATYDVTDRFEAYLEAAFTRNEARTNLAPTFVADFVTVNTDNPVLTPETRQVFEQQLSIQPGLAEMLLFRRMAEMGPRISDFTRDYTRVVAGVRGELSTDWEFDAWITWTDSSESELKLNDGSRSRFLQGLLVDPLSGQCIDPSGGCVPLDPFGEGRISQEAIDFIGVPGIVNMADREQSLVSMVVTGSPFEWRPGPVDMAFGAEWRRDEAHFKADDVLFTGDTMGFRGQSSVDGTESVFELYTEALVPIIDSQVTSHYLGAELGVRYSSYDNADSVWTWKAGLEWRPRDWLSFRTMFQHAVRAPNNGELFTEQFTEVRNGSPASFDPCSASNDPAGTGIAEKCILQGLPPDQIGVFQAQDFYPFDVVQGGNPSLEPEASDTTTVGVILNPQGAPNLTVAVDFFEAEVTGTIGGISPEQICYDPQNTGHAFCENIRRDTTGNVAEVVALISNRGLRLARGIDSQIQYQLELPQSLALLDGAADLGVGISWTHMLDFEDQQNVATRILECKGLFGEPCGTVANASFPENRVTANLDYASGPLSMHLTWRWIDGMLNAAPLSVDYMLHPDPILAVPDVPSYSYFDLGLGYLFKDSLQARFGINNLFDKDPPQMASTVFDNNTDSGLYDVFGRTFYVSLAWNSLP